MQIFQRRKENDLNVRDNAHRAPHGAAEPSSKGGQSSGSLNQPEERKRAQERPIVYELEP